MEAISSSKEVNPSWESTTNIMVSAATMAKLACSFVASAIIFSVTPGAANIPPVSIKRILSESFSTTISRVTPGLSCTMETLRESSLLKSLLLPTFGLPTRAMLFSSDDGIKIIALI